MKNKSKEKSFNDNLLRLEEISDILENENLDLEEAIILYEEGVELTKLCLSTLKSAELKITELKTKLSADLSQIVDESEEA